MMIEPVLPAVAKKLIQERKVKHWILFYDVVDDYVTRRTQFRRVHLEHAMAAHARNELVLAGALANPPDGAMLIFQGETPDAAERFAKTDPYVVNGVVTRWRVREWTTVVGDAAFTTVNLDKI
jgi:uncharacterized protein